jgi:thiol-disulfide isomerase/thioredoxin
MEATIDNGISSNSTFKGRGSSANNYMCNTPFPKGGSFLEAGRHIQPTPQETLDFILNTARHRQKELMSIKGVSTEFVRLEKARIKADIIKSIESVPSYSALKLNKETTEFKTNYVNEFISISKPVKDSLLLNFTDPTFLQLEVYRDIYNYLILDEHTDPKKVQVFRDYYQAYNLAYTKIKPLNDKGKLPAFKATVDSIKTKRYRDVLNDLITEKMKFGNGDMAIDFEVRNPDGTNTMLSSLKGKLIYIDLWATWCGPCMAEMPNLELLKKQYEGNPNIAIVSLSVDDTDAIWLRNLEKRKPGGIQWRIDRAKLAEYDVQSIPRYILIDQNFKVANFVAGHPSEPSLQQQLEQQLKK